MITGKMPFFSFHILDKRNINYLWITDGAIRVHKVSDVSAFYALFGYSEEMRKNLIEPDFYIWENYTKESALKEELCKQAVIIDYLNVNSVKFRTDYAERYENWLGTCNSKKLNLTIDCLSCKMHSASKTI